MKLIEIDERSAIGIWLVNKAIAPHIVGIPSIMENLDALSRSIPKKRAALIVTPEREAPGIIAAICAIPIRKARDMFILVLIFRAVLFLSASQRINPKRMVDVAMIERERS